MSHIYEYLCPINGITTPLLVDLPHGGNLYPDDFSYSCPKSMLEACEERFLDELYTAPTLDKGGALLQAKFPRTYVDPNRAANDIDPLLFETPWPNTPPQNGRSIHGHGVVMRLIHQGESIYGHPLTHLDVTKRIENYYALYHNALSGAFDAIQQKFGVVYHLDCHSMPSSTLYTTFPNLQPDFILGDLDGRSCGLDFRNNVATKLKDMGYRVAINQLYKGAEIVTRYGQPAWGRHSLQIEINRALFIEEQSGQKTNNFNQLKEDIRELIEALSVPQ